MPRGTRRKGEGDLICISRKNLTNESGQELHLIVRQATLPIQILVQNQSTYVQRCD